MGRLASSRSRIRVLSLAATWGILLLLGTGCAGEPSGTSTDAPEDDAPAESYNWGVLADSLHDRLHTGYWNDARQYYVADDSGNARFHYWWNAHALDALVDAYRRTGRPEIVDQMRALHVGIRKNSDGSWTNDYYDDMAWLALASLRAYRVTDKARYRKVAKTLWTEIKTGWNERQGGGIAWRRSQPGYKNTPANAPSALLAARLYQAFGDSTDLRWAHRIYQWQTEHLVDPETGLVWDGVNRQGNGTVDRDWIFTYNQGTYIGASLALYDVTGEDRYLEAARRTADYVLGSEELTQDRILAEEGSGDGGLFKGILVRYLAQLANEEDFDERHRRAYRKFLRTNAVALRDSGLARSTARVGPNWRVPPNGPVDLSVHLSGLMLIEAMDRLSR